MADTTRCSPDATNDPALKRKVASSVSTTLLSSIFFAYLDNSLREGEVDMWGSLDNSQVSAPFETLPTSLPEFRTVISAS